MNRNDNTTTTTIYQTNSWDEGNNAQPKTVKKEITTLLHPLTKPIIGMKEKSWDEKEIITIIQPLHETKFYNNTNAYSYDIKPVVGMNIIISLNKIDHGV